MVIPWWLFALVTTTLDAMLGSAEVAVVLKVFAWDLAFGAYLVFIVFRTPSSQSYDRLDFRGAAQNAYRALWWPWYVIQWVKRRR